MAWTVLRGNRGWGNAHNEVATRIVFAGKTPTDHIIGDGKEASLWAIGALDLGFLADTHDPLIGAGGLITVFCALATLEATRIDVFPSAE